MKKKVLSKKKPGKQKRTKKISPEMRRHLKKLEKAYAELDDCRETLRAIQSGEVDALVVSDNDGERIFTLKNADQPYRIFVETMNEGAATLSRDGVVYYCNQRFADMVDKPLETVIGSTVYELFPNSGLPDFDAFVETGKIVRGTRVFIRQRRAGKEIPLQLSLSVVQLEEALGVCVVATDLSEQHRLEESRADVERLKIEKEIRERFVSTLTHDLRTPLTAGLLAGQLLMRKEFAADDVKKIAKRIAGNMERADGMIRDLLDTNRLKAGEGFPLNIEACILTEIVENAVRTLSEIYGPRFVVNQPSHPTHGFWDPVAIQRCVENLAANAVKYGTPKSPVKIEVTYSKTKATISVHNEGNPISKEDQAVLFHSYHRTESAQKSGQKGWGIGLTLVKGIMEAHFGHAKVKSEKKSGTTFFIELPIDSRAKA